MTDRRPQDMEMIAIPTDWPVLPAVELEAVFGMNADQLYEENLRHCRVEGHDLEGGVMGDGREWFRCARCKTRFEEVDDFA